MNIRHGNSGRCNLEISQIYMQDYPWIITLVIHSMDIIVKQMNVKTVIIESECVCGVLCPLHENT